MIEAIKRVVWAITVQEAIGVLLLLGVVAYVIVRWRMRAAKPSDGSAQTTVIAQPTQLLGGFAAVGVAMAPTPPLLNYSISDFATGFAMTATCDRATPATPPMTFEFRAVTQHRANSAFNIAFRSTGVKPGRYLVPLTSTSGTAGIATLDSCGPAATPAGPDVPACADEQMGALQMSWSLNLDKPGAPLISLRIPRQLLPSDNLGADWRCSIREGQDTKRTAQTGPPLVIGPAAGLLRFGDKHFEADLGSGNVQFRPDITGDAFRELLDLVWNKFIGGFAGVAVIVAGIIWVWRQYRRWRIQKGLVVRVIVPEPGRTLGLEVIERTARSLSGGRCTATPPVGADRPLVLKFPDSESLSAFRDWLSSSGLGTLAPEA